MNPSERISILLQLIIVAFFRVQYAEKSNEVGDGTRKELWGPAEVAEVHSGEGDWGETSTITYNHLKEGCSEESAGLLSQVIRHKMRRNEIVLEEILIKY